MIEGKRKSATVSCKNPKLEHPEREKERTDWEVKNEETLG